MPERFPTVHAPPLGIRKIGPACRCSIAVWSVHPKFLPIGMTRGLPVLRAVLCRAALRRRLDEARRILNVAATMRNGARWSVALALGIRQGEALGLRWSYVNLDTGEIRAWFQIQRITWQHGCAEPHVCGEQ